MDLVLDYQYMHGSLHIRLYYHVYPDCFCNPFLAYCFRKKLKDFNAKLGDLSTRLLKNKHRYFNVITGKHTARLLKHVSEHKKNETFIGYEKCSIYLKKRNIKITRKILVYAFFYSHK